MGRIVLIYDRFKGSEHLLTGEKIMMVDKKYVLYAFNGDPMCFVHVLLNSLDMHAKGYAVKVVIEGSATKLIKEFHENEKAPFRDLYVQLKNRKIISAVCRACANKMGALEAAEAEKLPIVGDMNGHPSMSKYIDDGFQVISF